METNISGSASIWQNHCNGSTSQSAAITTNDTEQRPRKKTWSELKESVTELRKQLSRLSTTVPMNIHFRKLSDSRIRIYFLGTPPNGWETTLLCTDITPAMLTSCSDDEQSQQQQQTRYAQFRFLVHDLCLTIQFGCVWVCFCLYTLFQIAMATLT